MNLLKLLIFFILDKLFIHQNIILYCNEIFYLYNLIIDNKKLMSFFYQKINFIIFNKLSTVLNKTFNKLVFLIVKNIYLYLKLLL